MLNERIIPERRKDWWRQVNRPANFFKHADQDPDELLEGIDPIMNDHFILTNCLLFGDLEKRSIRPMVAYLAWYTGVYPEIFLDQGIPMFAEFKRLAVSVHEDLSRAEQLAFWQAILKLPSP